MRKKLRWVVLWNIDSGTDAIPCGFIIDMGDHVWVRLLDGGWGIKERFNEPMMGELTSELERRMYVPSDLEYFDCVVRSLFYTFAITDPQTSMERVKNNDD
jgi:hypothetical protein